MNKWPRGRWAWAAALGVAALLVLTVMDLGQHYEVQLGAVLALALARALALGLAWLRPRTALGPCFRGFRGGRGAGMTPADCHKAIMPLKRQ